MPHCPEDFKRGTRRTNNDIEDIYRALDNHVDNNTFSSLHDHLLNLPLHTYTSFSSFQGDARKRAKSLHQKYACRKSQVLYVYDTMVQDKVVSPSDSFRRLLVKKPTKSHSGVLVITVLTSPYPVVNGKIQRFSCQWNCYYCPNEPNQPRSYLHDEPSVIRANQNKFDPVLQFTDRATTLHKNGHAVDKIEILVLGGTWSSYPLEYRETFIRDIFYAANTFLHRGPHRRSKYTLYEEKHINTTSAHRIIGVTLETRPDCITHTELLHFRKVGCTRVQLGIQHTDNTILEKVNRKCSIETTKDAVRMLLNHGFKVDGHFMPQLPGASPADDYLMFETLLHDPDLQVDQWKIYPCEITPWTVIETWYKKGLYTPYSDEELIELLLWLKPKVHPWIRLNRVVRDIPRQYILGGINQGNLREVLKHNLAQRNEKCVCIRCREIKHDQYTPDAIEQIVRSYKASDGIEYFISFETVSNNKLLGFLRLRVPSFDSMNDGNAQHKQCVYPLLQNSAFIRELHVYGQVVCAGTQTGAAQHTGLGKRLLKKAESLARAHHKENIAVIAGVGTRDYYSSHHYTLLDATNGEMMVKALGRSTVLTHIANIWIVVAIVIVASLCIVNSYVFV